MRPDATDALRKRMLERSQPLPMSTISIYTASRLSHPSASQPKSRLCSIFGALIPSMGAPSPDGLDWTADRPHNPFDNDKLPFNIDGLFSTIHTTATLSPELDRLAALQSIVVPTITKLSTMQRETFLRPLPSPIQLAMNQPYGKLPYKHDQLLQELSS
jgi:hypothetical protein